MRAARARLHFLISVHRSRADSSNAFSFAGLAALGLVLELFVVEEKLFAGGEEKLRAAIDALEQPVLEFHVRSPRPSCELRGSSAGERGGTRRTVPNFRFGPPFPFRERLTTELLVAAAGLDTARAALLSGPLCTGFNPVLCEPSSGSSCEPALVLRASSRRVSDRKNAALPL